MPYLRARRVAAVRRRGSAGVHRRERRAHGEGQKGARAPYGSLAPLLTPPNPPLRRDSLRSRSETGETGARFRASGRFWDSVMPRGYFAWFAAHNSARPAGAGRQRSAAKSSASINGVPLEHQTSLWALAFRRAIEGSRVQRKMRGSQEGDKKPFGVLSPFCPRRRAAAPPCRRRRPLHTLTLSVKSPPPAAPLYRRKVCPLLQIKQKRHSSPAAASRRNGGRYTAC